LVLSVHAGAEKVYVRLRLAVRALYVDSKPLRLAMHHF